MKNTVLIFGALYGMLSVILGAFGAHAFKKILSPAQLESFETGVRYMMYSAFYLLLVGYILNFQSGTERWIGWLMIIGTLLFSASIYLLSFQESWGVNLRFLGPVTPIGGLMMIISWAMLMFYFFKLKN
ncbi:DUF423 domain-containing protein [Cruoricaptor ignavus]|uniref:DUF423 domain-containing protein n=1 Tax=Cruoricaptor ignavus TaxID=1118202 RepID=UPI00370D9DA2